MSSHADDPEMRTVETRIPARMDRLPWARWHWMVVLGLGLVWVLDGLEVTIVGIIGSRLTEDDAGLTLTASQVTLAASIYVVGACCGALFFGRMTDLFGRKKLFMVTLGLYLVATTLTAFSPTLLWFCVCRFFTGAGIGGEYAAINSAIDELIPARVRGTVDLIINGSFWLGTAGGAALGLLLLDTSIFAADVGWRLAFGLGAILGVGILIVRRTVPESPRWLTIHGREEEGEAIVGDIESTVRDETGEDLPEPDEPAIKVAQRGSISFTEIARTLFGEYRQRSVVGFSLFVGQAFLYNAVFFSYGLILSTFYDVDASNVPLYIIPFAIGNFLGPLLLGRLFDVVGRKPLIAGSYLISGVLLWVTAFLFRADMLNAETQTVAWCVIFFFASAGASAAYLTVSEIFPMETRAMAIAFFYAIGTLVGGATGPFLFGKLVETEKESAVFWGFALGATMMMAAGLIQAIWGVAAEQRSLEDVAKPLTAQDAEDSGDEGDEPERDDRPQRPAGRSGRFSRARAGEPVGAGARGMQTMWAPSQMQTSREPSDVHLQHEVETLERVLREHGPLTRRTLGDVARTKHWGPGRFGRALRQATAEGRIRRSGRDRYEAG